MYELRGKVSNTMEKRECCHKKEKSVVSDSGGIERIITENEMASLQETKENMETKVEAKD